MFTMGIMMTVAMSNIQVSNEKMQLPIQKYLS